MKSFYASNFVGNKRLLKYIGSFKTQCYTGSAVVTKIKSAEIMPEVLGLVNIKHASDGLMLSCKENALSHSLLNLICLLVKSY